MFRVTRWVVAAGVAGSLGCSSGEDENTGQLASGDPSAADARAATPDGGSAADGRDPEPTFDANFSHCDLPEPSLSEDNACCCDPIMALFPSPSQQEAGTEPSCDLVLPISRTNVYAVLSVRVELADAGTTPLQQVASCAGVESYTRLETLPETVRLCPTSCEAFRSGVYAAVRVFRGCPSIACPPP